jgi:hypothetical protein
MVRLKSCPDMIQNTSAVIPSKSAHSADRGSEHQKCRNSRLRTASRAKFSGPCGTQYSISRDRRAPLSCAHEPVTGRAMFFKLSKLINQEDALSAPCSPRAPSRGARNAADRLDPSLLMSHYGLLPNSSRRQALMSCRWLAALARVEGTDARPSRAVVKTALTCGFLLPK